MHQYALVLSCFEESMKWYGHVYVEESMAGTVQSCFKEDKNVTLKALKFEVSVSRERPKHTWQKQVENEMRKNGLIKQDAGDRTKW